MSIGHCEFCGEEILAPRDALVWVDDHTYHQDCYRAFLEQRIGERAAV